MRRFTSPTCNVFISERKGKGGKRWKGHIFVKSKESQEGSEVSYIFTRNLTNESKAHSFSEAKDEIISILMEMQSYKAKQYP